MILRLYDRSPWTNDHRSMSSWSGIRICSTQEPTMKTAFGSFRVFSGLGECPFCHTKLYKILDIPCHRSFPLSQLCSTIDKESLLPYPPTESRVAAFGSFTGQPFHPPLNTTSEDIVAIFCPSCSQPNSVPWITYKGDGFGQRAFSVVCSNCSMPFNREVCPTGRGTIHSPCFSD